MIPATHSPFGASWFVFWSWSIEKEPKLPKTLFTSRTCSEGRIVFHLSLFYLLAWSFASVVPFFVCLFSFSFARHLLGFVMIVKVLKVFGKTLKIVRVNLTCFLAFSLVSDSFGISSTCGTMHMNLQGWLREVQVCGLTKILRFIWNLKKVTLKY